MIETVLWTVASVITFMFLLWRTYLLGFKLGYKSGAEKVLEEWKKYMNITEDDE